MAIKRKGVLAVPGEYKFGDKTEIKTAYELKMAAQRQPMLYLTFGHPPDARKLELSDYIGRVHQKWNEEAKRVDATFEFFHEHIPDEVRVKIENKEPLALSTAYTLDSLAENMQKGILYDHVAILKDGEDPKCPLDQCGVNVRMERDSQIRYEQASELPDPEAESVEQKEEPKPMEDTGFNPTQLGQIRDLISELMPAPPVVEETEEVKEPVPEAIPEPEPQEAKVEPEVVIPAERTDKPIAGQYDAEGIQILGDEIK